MTLLKNGLCGVEARHAHNRSGKVDLARTRNQQEIRGNHTEYSARIYGSFPNLNAVDVGKYSLSTIPLVLYCSKMSRITVSYVKRP